MIITNTQNLPQPFVAMAQQDYTCEPNEWRVTSLLKGIRESILERRHEHEIKRDVSDMIWLLFGTAVHSILERQEEGAEEIKEARIKVPVGDYILSGQFDLYDAATQTITDYKTTSVWKIIFGDFEDWHRQLLIYAWMMKQTGFPVQRGQIIAILKDHSKRDARIKADYPPLPVKAIPFTFDEVDFADIETWLQARFADIAEAEKLPDYKLPLCTLEERFNDGDKFAVMKKGKKRALKVCNSEFEAEVWMQANSGDYIERRPGEDKKCIDYCAVANFCSHYQARYGKSESRKEESA